jgi:hypothetical protein
LAQRASSKLPASPVALDHDVGHRVNFTVVVDPAALASPDGAAGAQDALSEDSRRNDAAGDEVASEGAAEALEPLADKVALAGVKAVELELSAVAATLGAMARRQPTVTELREDDCRWPVDLVVIVGELPTRIQHVFCQNRRAPGRPYCTVHTAAAYVTTKGRSTPQEVREARRRYEEKRRLTGLGLRAALGE